MTEPSDSSQTSAPLPDFDALWDYDDPAGTEAEFRELLPAAERSGNRAYHAELLTQIARAQGLQREFEAAHATLDEVEPLLTDDMHRPRVRSLLERGRTLNSEGRRDEARPLFLEAWELARRWHLDGLAVDAAHMIAIVEPPEDAVRWNERALELAESSTDPDARRWTGSLCNNIGWTHHGEGAYETALGYFERALEHRLEQGKADDIGVARWCIARCLRSLGRLQEALAIQYELERESADLEHPDGYVPEEIAECLHALGRTEEARPYFRRAHEILSEDPWLAENERERLERLDRLAAGTGGEP